MTELLLETDLKPRQRHLAQTAYRSAESLLEVINNILDFSKIEAGKLHLRTANFNLRQILEDTLELVADLANANNWNWFRTCRWRFRRPCMPTPRGCARY